MIIDALIDSKELARISALVSTASGLRKALKRSESAKKLYRAFSLGEIPIDRIEAIVRELTDKFQRGVLFRYESEMCLLAVVIEEHDSETAEKFLNDLAEVRVAEMPMSPRVAALCLRTRRLHPRNQLKDYGSSEAMLNTFEELFPLLQKSSPGIWVDKFEGGVERAS
jgi:hypothetical protein